MKKVLSLVLAVVLVLGMTTIAFAKNDLKRTAWKDTPTSTAQPKADFATAYSLFDAYTGTDTLSNYTAVADKKVLFYLDQILTGAVPVVDTDKTSSTYNKTVGYSAVTLTTSMVSGDDWGVGYKVVKGSQIVSKCDIDKDGSRPVARVVFQKYFPYTKDIDWEVEMWLTNNKSRIRGSEVTVSGTYLGGSASLEVDADDTYVYVGDGDVVKATEYIRNIELDLGHDVSIFTKLFQDKKYFGIANEDANDADINMFEKYPQLENVYNLVTSGLAGAGNIVKLSMDDNLYVYSVDADGNLFYVGRSKDMLPYYSKYYVSSKEIDVADIDVDVTDGGAPTDVTDTDIGNVVGGGDDIDDLVNDNPGTGC